ncbi:MAG: hypothetical protein AAF545_14500 [Pseudomonadota bacterium]
MLKQLAAWVLQSRHRLTIAVAFLLLLPLFNFLVPMVAVAGVLQFGPLAALPWLAGGWGIVGAMQVLLNPEPLALIYIASAGVSMALAVVLATVLGRSGSLTLSLQAALLAAVALLALTYAVVDDVAGQSLATVQGFKRLALEAGTPTSQFTDEDATLLSQFLAGSAAAWTFYGLAVSVLGGYAAWDQGVDKGRARFGRFRDLNMGRALAATLVGLAVLGTFTVWLPVVNMALLLLLAFGLHGCALAHWLRNRFDWPDWSLVAFYGVLATTVLGNPFAVVLVCVAGYVDAWFNMVRVAPPGQAR